MKDHQITELVNSLTKTAETFSRSQSLRERIKGDVMEALKAPEGKEHKPPTHPEGQEDWKPDYSVAPRRVVSAAMMRDGRIITGARHFDRIMKAQMEATEGLKWWNSCEQGFIDQFGDFMSREVAWVVAVHQKQIFQQCSAPGTLYSENLY
jgi:hypothetical protein